MPATHLLMSGFQKHATPEMLFSDTPRLTIRQAFHEAGEFMPAGSSVVFHQWQDIVSIDIYPFCTPEDALAEMGPEPSHFSYKFFPAFQSALISRIKAEGTVSRGIGSAMIASQYPFMQKMRIEALGVVTHVTGEGFYRKLGFEYVPFLPEKPDLDSRSFKLMRIDLAQPLQKSAFETALVKARPLTDTAFRL